MNQQVSEAPEQSANAELAELREQLRRATADYDQFRLHLPEAFVEVRFPSFQVSYMNQVARALLGYGEEDIAAGIHGYALLDERSLLEVMDAATKHLAASTWIGKPYEREPGQRIFHLTLIRKDGSRFPSDVQGSYILDEAEAPCGVRYIFRDTTTREVAEQERARLAALVESSDDAIISRALDGAILSWNGGAERMYGYTAAEMVGSGLGRVELPELSGQMDLALEAQAAGERSVLETRRMTRDGRVLDVSVSLFPVHDNRGEVVAVGGIGRDIGERNRAAAALARSNEMLAALSAAQALFIRERNARAVFEGLLPTLLRLTESDFGFIGEIFHNPDGTPYLKTHAISNIGWDDASRKFFADNYADGLEFRALDNLFGVVVKTGNRVITNDPANDPRSGGNPAGHPPIKAFMGLPIFIGDDLIGMIGTANRPGGYDEEIADFLSPFLTTCGTIIEALNAEKARRAAEERLDLAMRGAELALWEWDIPSNNMAATFPEGGSHGYDLSGKHDLGWLMERVHPEDQSRLVNAFIGHVRGDVPLVECEHRVINGRGDYRWMLTRGMVVSRDVSGNPLRAAGTFLDITERKLATDERERLEQQVRQSQKLESLGVFAGGIAHDFNNLLTAILGNLYLLNFDATGAQSELVSEARQAAERGAELVRRLLSFARPEVDGAETVDLDQLIRETASLARAALTPSVSLTVRKATGSARIHGSPISLQQVLMNLLVNGRDAMPAGGELTVSRRTVTIGPRHRWATPELPHGRYHVISVGDTGQGMAAELQERIFDPFFTTKDIGRGSGLGLSTALGIARAHGGWLSVESMAGQGSTFSLLLPAEPSSDEAGFGE